MKKAALKDFMVYQIRIIYYEREKVDQNSEEGKAVLSFRKFTARRTLKGSRICCCQICRVSIRITLR